MVVGGFWESVLCPLLWWHPDGPVAPWYQGTGYWFSLPLFWQDQFTLFGSPGFEFHGPWWNWFRISGSRSLHLWALVITTRANMFCCHVLLGLQGSFCFWCGVWTTTWVCVELGYQWRERERERDIYIIIVIICNLYTVCTYTRLFKTCLMVLCIIAMFFNT